MLPLGEIMGKIYKKLSGTSAVFILDSYAGASPVEREGMVWTEDELQLKDIPSRLNLQSAMANGLALEGLEEYQPPSHGDLRQVDSLGVSFVYSACIKGWVQWEQGCAAPAV